MLYVHLCIFNFSLIILPLRDLEICFNTCIKTNDGSYERTEDLKLGTSHKIWISIIVMK